MIKMADYSIIHCNIRKRPCNCDNLQSAATFRARVDCPELQSTHLALPDGYDKSRGNRRK